MAKLDRERIEVLILGIRKATNKDTYLVKVQYKSQSGAFNTTEYYAERPLNVGTNFDEGLDTLGGGTYPESLQLPGYMELIKYTNGTRGLYKVELTAEGLRILRSNMSGSSAPARKLLGNEDGYNYVRDFYPMLTDADPYVEGVIDSVYDGDTIKIKVSKVNKMPASVQIGNELSVRFVGVLCPETKKDNGDWASRNAEWAAEHGMEPPSDENKVMDKILNVAYDAKRFVEAFIGRKVLVDPEAGDAAMDIYGRALGVVYVKLDQDVTNEAENAICINTSVIANLSTKQPEFALGEPTYKYSIGTNGIIKSKFPLHTWWRYAPNYEEKLKELQKKQDQRNRSGKEAFLEKYGLELVTDTSDAMGALDNKTEIVYNNSRRIMTDATIYKVQKGDTLFSILSKFPGMAANDVIKENGLPQITGSTVAAEYSKGQYIHEGQELTIPTYETFTDTERALFVEDKLNNTNLVPADSETEDYINSTVDDRNRLDEQMGLDPTNPYTLRIGDCSFLVPPLSIRFDTLSANRRIQALRSKSSIQTRTGYASTVITVDLFFPNLDAVNGYEYKNPIPGQSPYYRNGLRPLIAQFKKAPFLPIENELINERYKIYAVALKDLEVTSVPGFPNCMQVRLTLHEFDHSVYMPHEEDFASTFCWPLYRWFYQRSMRESEDKTRTYLKKLSGISNEIKFYLPDEGALNERRQAINELSNKLHPQIFKDTNTKDGTMMGEMLREANEIQMANEQYKGFIEALKKFPPSQYPKLYKKQGLFDLRVLDPGQLELLGGAKELIRYSEALRTIFANTYYEGGEISGPMTIYFIMNTLDAVMDLIEYSSKITHLSGNNIGNTILDALGTSPIRFEILERRDVTAWNRNHIDSSWFQLSNWGRIKALIDNRDVVTLTKDYINKELLFPEGGAFVVEMTSSNARKVPGKIVIESWKDAIPPYHVINPKDAAIIRMITDVGEATELAFVDYELGFEKLNFKAHMSEADIPEIEFPIGDLIIQSVTAGMHNVYAPLQLSSKESPTFQHLGSSDITLDMTIRTKSREAVEKFRQLMSNSQRLAREYRIAITSGIISIDSTILSIFGVKSILIERLSVETSKEDKESFIISISLVAFDKTQRAREDLDMTPAFGGASEEVENAFYSYSQRRRNESGFEYAIIDFKLRDLEIYPDLELPTFEEVNQDLPMLKIKQWDGSIWKHYTNSDNARFVDPDFYIRCDQTMRDYMYAILEDGELPIYLKDRLGFEGFDTGPTSNQQKGLDSMDTPNLQFSDETMEWIRNNINEVYVGGKKDSPENYKYSDANGIQREMYEGKTTDDLVAKDVRKAEVGSMAADVAEQEKQKINKTSVSARPTPEELRRWFNIPESYASTMSFKEPTEKEFIAHLTYLVGEKYWPSLPSDKEAIEAGRTDVPTYVYGKTRVSAPSITKEKIVNVMKALYDLEHSWKQFNPDGSVCWSKTNDIGIGQLNAYTSGILQNLDMARRAAWDWRYNLQLGVEFFAQMYNFCINSADRYNKDAKANPLDWAIVCYNKGPVSGLKNYAQPQEVDYYDAVMSRFKNKYGADPVYMSATPNALYNENLANEMVDAAARIKEVRSKIEVKNVTGKKIGEFLEDSIREGVLSWAVPLLSGKPDLKVPERETLRDKTLADYEEYKKFYMIFNDVLVMDPGQQLDNKINASNGGYEGSRGEIIDRLTLYMRKTTVDKDTQYILINRGASTIIRQSTERVPDSSIFEVLRMDIKSEAGKGISQVEVRQALDPLIVAPDDIAVLYRTSFNDMMEHDMRGRMLRAFPTFQMFLVDEGRWMAWHKLWDNFYGYNSIVSIDLVKDRKMAADTAIINMTNVYSNLSTYDNEVSYGEWDFTLGDLIWGTKDAKDRVWKTIWDLPDRDVLAARRDELNSMMLKPGARIHLRMGYGANAYRLPVVFNGTVTEMNTGEVVTLVAQGDGIELTNKLRVSPGDTTTNKILGMFALETKEPREVMGEMLTSKGSFFKDIVSKASGGVFFNSHPLGIAHFGTSDIPAATILRGIDMWDRFEEYGECAQNIYCSAGINTMSQWMYTEGMKEGQSLGFKWNWMDINGMSKGDEPNIKIDLFDKTPWSLFQLYAHACPDYVSTVLPFEFRSTVFYGKPWWGLIDKYKYKYFYDSKHDMFLREPAGVVKKAMSQMRMYSSYFDIIHNDIKATEEFMYTNVIGVYDEDKRSTRVIQADSDILPDKQTTATIHIPIKSDIWFTNKWTQGKYAEIVATSALRDYIKDMYQGDMIVLGDPTVKPYDKMYIQDNHTDMSGMAEVKRVVHHFSIDTGFLTNITPDCISVIDDMQGISSTTWASGALIGLAAFAVGTLAKNAMWKVLWTSPAAAAFRKGGRWAANKLFTQVLGKMAEADAQEMRTLEAASNEIVDYFKSILSPKGDVAKAIKVDGAAVKKKLNDILLRQMKTTETVLDASGNWVRRTTVTDTTLSRLAGLFTKSAEAVKAPGGVGKYVDTLWDSLDILKEGKLFTKSSNLFAKMSNTVFKGASGLTKFGLKAGGNTAAAAIRGSSALVAKVARSAALRTTLIGLAVDIGITILTASLVEEYGRWLKSRQALTIVPLKYRGKPFVAGINGHKGLLAGEEPGGWDKFLAGAGFGGGAIKGIYGFLGVEADENLYGLGVEDAMKQYYGGNEE